MPLDPQQIKAAKLLAKGQNQTQVAKSIGISRRTIVRWMADGEFKNLCFALSGEAQPVAVELEKPIQVSGESNTLTVQSLVLSALQAVQEVLISPDTRPSDRLRAAALVGQWSGLEHRGKTAELEAFRLLAESNLLPSQTVEQVGEAISECFRNIRSVMGVQKQASLLHDESWIEDLELEENA